MSVVTDLLQTGKYRENSPRRRPRGARGRGGCMLQGCHIGALAGGLYGPASCLRAPASPCLLRERGAACRRGEVGGGLPAVAAHLRQRALQRMPLRPGGGGLITSYGRDAVGDRAVDVRRRRQLAARRGDAAALAGRRRRPARRVRRQRRPGSERRHRRPRFRCRPTSAARVGVPRGFSVDGDASACAGRRAIRTRTCRARTSSPCSTSRFISREHYVMWQPRGARALRADGALLRALRPALRRARPLHPARPRLRSARGDLQPVGRATCSRRLGAARHGVRARLRSPHRQRREGLRRLLRTPAARRQAGARRAGAHRRRRRA